MIKFPQEWDTKKRIEYLQRKIIILSIAYYERSISLVDDFRFDSLAFELVRMQKEYSDIYNTHYGYMMYDFDGSTGFDLYCRLNKQDCEHLDKVTNLIVQTFLLNQKDSEKYGKVKSKKLF